MSTSNHRRARTAHRWAQSVGWNVWATAAAGRNLGGYLRDARRFRAMGGVVDDYWPHFGDRGRAGVTSGHYFWQDLLVARRVATTNPLRHMDVGSRIDGFVAHLLTFREVEVVDIRELASPVSGLTFVRADGRTLAGVDDRSIDSLSSLHAMEHFGLGRYGDPLDPEGHHRGLRAAQRVLAPGGRFWVSFPIGTPRVHFNAHRVLDPLEPISVLDELVLVDFTAIPIAGPPHESADPGLYRNDDQWCGLYEFMRPVP